MQTPLHGNDSAQSVERPKSSLLPAMLGLPVAFAGLLLCLGNGVEGPLGQITITLLGALYLFYLWCVVRMHRRLASATGDAYPIQVSTSLIINVIAGPLAAFLAWQFSGLLLAAVSSLAELVDEVMPNSWPIANSAAVLLIQYGAFLAVAIACGAALCCQLKSILSLRAFLESRKQMMGKQLALLAAATVAIGLTAPGCLALPGISGLGSSSGSDHLLIARFVLASYGGLLCVFAIMAILTTKVERALAASVS